MNISQNLKRVTVWSCKPTTCEHTSGKTVIQEDTCTSMFTATLLAIAKTWQQPTCPSTEEWINKMWYTCTMECYLAVKTNEITPFKERWMNLAIIILNEISQTNIIYHLYVECEKKDTNKFIYKAAIDPQA